MTVIQTGSIALQAFLIGDYASELLRLGDPSASVYAGLVILTVTGVNLAGLRMGRWAQRALTGATVLGLLFIAVVGLGLASSPAEAPALARRQERPRRPSLVEAIAKKGSEGEQCAGDEAFG
jgi:hypothetical protein